MHAREERDRGGRRLPAGWWMPLALGALLRLAFVWKHPALDGDPQVYADLARNVLAHHVYGLTENVIRPTLIRLPGYPLFLALCFALFGVKNFIAVMLVQCVLGLGACWMLARVAGRMFGARAALWTLWLACLCPFTAEYDALPLTESLSIVCVIAAIFALERWLHTARWRWVWMLGSACAFAVLLRPDEGLLAAAFIPALLFAGRRRVAACALASLIVALPLGVWTVRNLRTLHTFQPLAPKYANDAGDFVGHGFYRWYRTWGVEYWSTTNTYWMWDGAPLSMGDLPARAIDSPSQRQETAKLYADYNDVQAGTPGLDARFGRLAAERERAHPVRTFVLMPVGRLLDMWLRPRTEFFALPLAWWQFSRHPGMSIVCVLWGALDWALLLAAGLGLRRWRWDAVGVAAVAFVALRCALLLTIDNSEPRYTLVCFPVVFLLAAVWLTGVGCRAASSGDRLNGD